MLHQIHMEELIEAGARDSGCSDLDYWQNEVDKIVDKHLAAGLPLQETGWSVGARFVAPHDAYEHCSLCCEFADCDERLEERRAAGRTWETWVGNRD